jgi:hypothetical protein
MGNDVFSWEEHLYQEADKKGENKISKKTLRKLM